MVRQMATLRKGAGVVRNKFFSNKRGEPIYTIFISHMYKVGKRGFVERRKRKKETTGETNE